MLDRTPLWNIWAPRWLGSYGGNQLLTGIFSGILWLPLEAFGLSWKAATPGKWLYGLRVRQRGARNGARHPADSVGLRRPPWHSGSRPAAVVLLFINYRRIVRGEPAYWDRHCATVIERVEFTWWRLLLGLSVTVALAWLLADSRGHPVPAGPVLLAG